MRRKIAVGLACLMLIGTAAPQEWVKLPGDASGIALAATGDEWKTSYSPASGSLNVSLTPGMTMTFDRKVKLASDADKKSIFLLKSDGSSVVKTFRGDQLIEGDGLQVSLPSVGELEANTRYYVKMDSGILIPEEAEVGEPAWNGINDRLTWVFTTGSKADVTDPKLVGLTPAAGALGIKPDTAIQLVFDEAVDVSKGDLILYEADDPEKEKSKSAIRISVLSPEVQGLGTASVSIKPSSKEGHGLKSGVTYGVYASPEMFADLAGNTYKNKINWTFRTESADNVPPTVKGLIPQNGLGGAPMSGSLSINFTEKVTRNIADLEKKNPKASIYRLSDGRKILELSPKDFNMDAATGTVASASYAGLERGTSYYVLADADMFRDEDGTSFAGIRSSREWTFTTTGDALAVSMLSPAAGAIGVPAGAALQATFTREIYPNTDAGNIQIRRGDGVLINAEMTGGGTNKLTLIPSSALLSGYTYTVILPAGLLSDSEGNAYPKAGQALNWTFSTTTNDSVLKMASLWPSDRSMNVSIDVKPAIRFNSSVKVDPSGITLYRSGGTKIAADISVNPNDASEVVIAPKEKLTAATSYYIDVDSGAVSDRTNGGLSYSGLKGGTAWGFQTAVSDIVVPAVKSGVMDHAKMIKLTYTKTLNPSQIPLLSSYTVLVNGEKRMPETVRVSGDSVYLQLATGVAVGQDVKLSYDPGVRPLVDQSGNQASSFASYTVTNSIDTALPKPKEGSVYGTTLTLVFENNVKFSASQMQNQFTVTADGKNYEVLSVSGATQALVLYLAAPVSDGSVVKVTYKPGAAPIQDNTGQNIAAFSDYIVRNLMDTRPPEFINAELSGTMLTLNYNEPLRTDSLPTNSQFSVLNNGVPVYVNAVKVEGSSVRLTLASSLIANGAVTVSYVPGTLKLTDLNSNAAGYLNLQPVEAGAGTSGIRSVVGRGSEIVLTFTGALYQPEEPAYAQFSVLANEASIGVSSASLSGNTLTLKLASELKPGQKVDLTYQPASNPLKNVSGTNLTAFSRMPVQNVTGLADNGQASNNSVTPNVLPASDFGTEMTILGRSAASSTDVLSALNANTHRYDIKPQELKPMFDAAYEQSGKNGTVVFEVPNAENSGYVAVPLQELKTIRSQRNDMTFAVRYKDTVYEIPLSSLDAITGDANAKLIVQIEPLPASSSERTISMLANAGAQMLTAPVDIRTSLESSTGSPVAMDLQGKYRLKLNVKSPVSKTSVVYFDENDTMPSFVPSKSFDQPSNMLLTGMFSGSRTLVPVSSTASAEGAAGHWSEGIVNELAAKSILSPAFSRAFAPKNTITRGEFAELIARGLGLSGDSMSAAVFSDIGYSRVPIPAIGAAVKAGIITGNTDGTFRPNDSITREQMAIMMVRALTYTGVDVTLTGSAAQTLASFKDRSSIKFVDEAAKAVQAGVIQGASGGRFNPKGSATRAEAAVMLQRVLKEAGYLN